MKLNEYASTRNTWGGVNTPKSVQKSISVDRIYDDGMWRSGNVYSQMWSVSDINYAMVSDGKKDEIQQVYGKLYAGVPSDCTIKMCIVSQRMDDLVFRRDVLYHRANDGHDDLRAEKNRQLAACASLVGNVLQSKYVIVSTQKNRVEDARDRLRQVQGHQLLSDEMRPMLVQLCGTGTSTGTAVPPVGDGSMIWPLPGHTSLTTHFGEADAFGNPGHRGIDIPAPEGTPILAAHSGTVLICGWNDSFGNQVLIDDGAGLSTRYAHMTATAVSPGAVVTAGQVIGYVGSTGDSTGNHLHFEVSVGGTLTDPLDYVIPQ